MIVDTCDGCGKPQPMRRNARTVNMCSDACWRAVLLNVHGIRLPEREATRGDGNATCGPVNVDGDGRDVA